MSKSAFFSNKRRILIVALSFAALVLCVAGIVMSLRGAVIITVTTAGGMCPGGPCSSTQQLHAGGLYGTKRVSSKDMATIHAIIDRFDPADYPKPEMGDCGSSVIDGSDMYFTFEKKYPNRRFESCQYVGNSGLSTVRNDLEILADILDR